MSTPPAGYETVAQAAVRLERPRSWIWELCSRGRVPGAQQVARGKRNLWYVPAGFALAECRHPRHATHAERCDCCSIILEHSGDDNHPNDAPDAGRCWFCREHYPHGWRLAAEDCSEEAAHDKSGVSHASTLMCVAPSTSCRALVPAR